jgi:hypothetical protein
MKKDNPLLRQINFRVEPESNDFFGGLQKLAALDAKNYKDNSNIKIADSLRSIGNTTSESINADQEQQFETPDSLEFPSQRIVSYGPLYEHVKPIKPKVLPQDDFPDESNLFYLSGISEEDSNINETSSSHTHSLENKLKTNTVKISGFDTVPDTEIIFQSQLPDTSVFFIQLTLKPRP